LRAVGAANQGQRGHSDQTEQQALQHALLSRNQVPTGRQYNGAPSPGTSISYNL
jgi:hypothetical protein